MRRFAACLMWVATAPALLVAANEPTGPAGRSRPCVRGTFLRDIPWTQAEKLLTKDTVVVLPLGAEAKEHGPHLPLNTDWLTAEYLAARVARARKVVVAPTLNYHHFPGFVDYPGSTSLRRETARDLVVDVCQSFARHGVRKVYVLNTGFSSQAPLAEAKATLAASGLTLAYTDNLKGGRAEDRVIERMCRQSAGTHADEVETSMMLYIAPKAVDMRKAVCEVPADPKVRRFTRNPTPAPGAFHSPSGVFGDATLATRAKGQAIVEAMVQGILAEIDALVTGEPET